ncbi:MAG: rhodanese-like domain-containing protein, partial [Acidimicrobiia bacterium]|nr:rhodanese-like domain-containing protein [Acidimicrobiia bacterium]
MIPSYREVRVNDYRSVVGADGQLIDVRQPEEVRSTGVIPGAVNIPLGEIPGRLAEIDPGRPVALVCRSGGRSGSAGQFLAMNGYAS